MKGLVLAIVMGSLFATTKRANRLTHIKRQILMVLYSLFKLCQFLLPLYVSFKVLHFYIESHAPFILISFLLPVFILSIFPLPLILIRHVYRFRLARIFSSCSLLVCSFWIYHEHERSTDPNQLFSIYDPFPQSHSTFCFSVLIL